MSESANRVEPAVLAQQPLRGSDLTQAWTDRFQRFANAKLSINAFCATEGISKATFFLWRKRLAPNPTPTSHTPTPLVPIHITPMSRTPIELAFPSGTVVRFPADTPPNVIVAVLRGLEPSSC